MTNRRHSSLLSFFRRARVLPLVTLLVLVAPMLPRIALADSPSPAGQAGVYPASAGIPETGASVANGVNPVSVEPSTGIAHVAISFSLPRARGRSQPHLGLTYSSQGGVGVAGWGWSMSLPSIERTPLSGSPTYADPPVGGAIDTTLEDRFSFDGEPLVPICTVPSRACNLNLDVNAATFVQGTYTELFPAPVSAGWSYFRLEKSGSDGRFFWSPDHKTWIVQYKSGETLELGHPLSDPLTDAIDVDVTDSTKAFRWNVVRQYDSERSAGGIPLNRIIYQWQPQAGDSLDRRLYLTDVYDTLGTAAAALPETPSAFAHHVRFFYGNQNPPAPVPGFTPPIWKMTTRFSLLHVDVTAAWDPSASGNGTVPRSLVRRYWLTYTFPDDYMYSGRFSLGSVQEEGRCDTAGSNPEDGNGNLPAATGCRTLPKTSYGYEPSFPSFQPTPLANQLGAVRPGDSTYVLDMNSDGVPDVVTMNKTVGNIVYPVSETSLNTLGNGRPLLYSYPPGQPSALPAPSNQWTAWSSPEFYLTTPGQEPGLYLGTPVPQSPSFPGNYLGDGRLNQIVPEGFSGPVGSSTNYVFSILTPSLTPSGTYLSGTTTGSLTFWTPVSTSSCCLGSGFSHARGAKQFAENVYGIVDIDGDGLQDAITDTPYAATGTITGFPNQLPYVHFLSARTTMQRPDGSVSIFSRPAPNLVPHVVPSYPWTAAQIAALPNVYPPPPLPANGQYVTVAEDDNCSTPLCRIFGDVNWQADITGPAGADNPQLNPDAFNVASFFEDMNGDGLADWVSFNSARVSPDEDQRWPRPGKLIYWVGHGDGTFGSCASGLNDCAPANRMTGALAATTMTRAPFVPAGGRFVVHDVTGDGLPDVLVLTPSGMTVYINEQGVGFDTGSTALSARNTGSTVPLWDGTAQVFVGDMNGSGVDDIILVQGKSVYYVDVQTNLRPGLLTTITNGYGATTSIAYASTSELQRETAYSSTQWARYSPQILHHVTKITSTNGFQGTTVPFAETRTVEYTYTNPAYDGRDRQFAGFQTVTVQQDGDANEPTRVTQTTYLSGICEIDAPAASACPAASADRPYRALRGLPVLTEVFGIDGRHLSATHTQYTVNKAITGEDGRGVRFAYASQTKTFLYEPTAYIPPRSSLAQFDALFEETGPTNIAHFYALDSSAASPFVQLVRGEIVDNFGNLTDSNDQGRVGIDSPIHATTTWALPAGDPTAWQWRPKTQHRDASPATPGVPADLPADVTSNYYPDGQLQSASVVVAGVVPLSRATGAALTPSTALANGSQLTASVQYDSFGNPTYEFGAGGARCTRVEYDLPFSQLPTTTLAFRDGCNTVALTTSQAWDRGIEQVTLTIGADGSHTQYGYDNFGRVASITQPNATTGGLGDSPTTTIIYYDGPANSSYSFPVRQTAITIQDGTAQRHSWQYADAWGQPLMVVSTAGAAGDDGSLIVSGVVQRSARGHVVRAEQPFFWSGNAATFPLASAFPKPSVTQTYDAFGHVIGGTGFDGRITYQATWHALGRDTLDAEQIAGGGHAGAMSKTAWDGHGRVASVARDIRSTSGGATDEVTIATIYNSSGQPLQIKQSHTGDATVVSRTFQYDSLGHLVSNVEPNTSSSGIGWRYVYDASGDLVGTSDARGCGENLVYDGLGRLRWEDYSPCTADQAKYTSAPSTFSATASASTVSGAETFYSYDTAGSSMLDGRLYEVYDRAAHTSVTYDGRGRASTTTRTLATPEWTSQPAIASAANYSTHSFTKAFGYDGLNRPTSESTGADVTNLLGQDVLGTGTNASKSMTSVSYSARGIAASVQGSYGTLLASNVVDANAAPLTSVLGDAAGTTASTCYDGDGRPLEISISRGRALPSCAHAALGLPAAAPAQAQTVLLDETFRRDFVGNPITIADGRVASEWHSGSMPVVRSFQYDDAYRVTQAIYNYATSDGNDAFNVPLPASVPYQAPMSIASAPRVRQQTITYDWLGNTSSSTDDQNVFFDRSLGGIHNGTAAAGPNQMTSAGDLLISNGKSTGGAVLPTYDAAGNTTALAIHQTRACSPGACPSEFQYEWDEVGQLARAQRWDGGATTPAADVIYSYDASGKRVLRASLQADGTRRYDAEIFTSLRLGHASWDDTARTYERDATTEAAYLTVGGASYGRVLVNASVQHVLLELGDSLGSTSVVIDKATGELVERVTYYAYGGVESDYRAPDWASFWESYKFTGKESDLEIGLTYFGARYYSPQLGRWISPDPLTIHEAAADLNPYAYVGGRVSRSADPDGLQADDSAAPPPPSGCADLGVVYCFADDPIVGPRAQTPTTGPASLSEDPHEVPPSDGQRPANVHADWSAAQDAVHNWGVDQLAGLAMLAAASLGQTASQLAAPYVQATSNRFKASAPSSSPRDGYGRSTLDSYQSMQRLLTTISIGIALAVPALASTEVVAAEAAEESLGAPGIGDKVFRVYGENNNPLGQSWTRVDPGTVDNFREVGGLPDVNTGRFVIEGRLSSVDGVTTRTALPLDGHAGGIDEVLIPNAARQVTIEGVSGANPEF